MCVEHADGWRAVDGHQTRLFGFGFCFGLGLGASAHVDEPVALIEGAALQLL